MGKNQISDKIKNKFKLANVAKKYEETAELLQTQEKGFIKLEKDEKMPTQKKIKMNVANSVREKAFSLNLEESNWKSSYSIDGRFLLLHNKSSITVFDNKTLNVFYEREIKNIETSIFLHNEQYCAISADSFYIYNKNGQEIHHLPKYRDVKKMTFLPDHFLLATLHRSPFLKYFDTSIGKEVAAIFIKEKNCSSISRRSDGIVLIGGNKGTVSFYSPNTKEALCKILVNSAKITSISVKNDNFACSSLQGTYFYDFRKLNEPIYRLPKSENVSLSNTLAFSFRNTVCTFLNGNPYVKETYKGVNSIEFAPYEDILTVGTSLGLRNMIVPGSGEANIDADEDSPFLTKKQRKEREIQKLLQKIPSTFIGSKFIVDDVEEIKQKDEPEKPKRTGPLARFY
ncbi:WD40-repeat-containing subunit of the 18S rRNA processing complex [Pseudoloma neurophilia]|uniref:WD40-repeat-containing subunit of the 18S rRNA processing complex n=1 Tax=Pseudoloma neurophilia TaxID=146866 RepID=A0A0R0LZL4_9MICR|nr:WD40-repeat-containing subunit of the 18S rRNA processing complex [Pseudoloma neurophilia]